MTKETSVSWKINFGTNGSLSSLQAADEAGVIALERKNFLDREHKPSSVVLSIGYGSSEEPYFLVELPVPPDLDQLTPVNIQLWPVEILISGVAASGSDGKAAVEIKRHREEVPGDEPERYVYFDALNRELTVTINTPVRLSMMSGSYDLEILAPGAERATTTFKVDNKPTRVPVRLQPGGDMRVELVRPDGEREVSAVVLRDGQEMTRSYFDYKTETYRGLPVGNYVLHVPSSAEMAARSGERNIAVLHPYAGRDLPFTIVGNQATPVELGEIRLEAAGN